MDVLHLIAGRWVEGDGAEFAGTNPARPSEVVARGRFASVSEVEQAVAAARDLGAALRAVDRLEVGVLHVISESAGTFPHVPFGGAEHSGYGPKEQGRAARDFYTRTVTVYLGEPA